MAHGLTQQVTIKGVVNKPVSGAKINFLPTFSHSTDIDIEGRKSMDDTAAWVNAHSPQFNPCPMDMGTKHE